MSSWTQLKSIGFRFFPTPIKLNDNQFALVPTRWLDGKNEKDGIYAYDTRINDWHRVFAYPKDLKTSSHSAIFDKDRNTIYIFNSSGTLLKCDLKTQTVEIIPHTRFGSYPGFVMIKDILHIFGYSRTHEIYDIKNKKFTPDSPPDDVIFGRSATYLKSKNVIIFVMESKVYKYSLLDRKWSVENIETKSGLAIKRSTAITATVDDKYVITIEDGSQGRKNKGIFIYDVDRNFFLKSKVKSPLNENSCKIIIMNDEHTSELLTFGFVRNVFNELPVDIINTIVNWVTAEDLHLIENAVDGKHWRIGLHEILQFE